MVKVEWINKDEVLNELKLAGWIAAVSTDTTNVDYEKIAKHCIASGHGTPTRAMRFVFEISEVSRVFSHEFVRHEIGLAKCQRSQRYVKEDGFGYVTPKELEDKIVDIEVINEDDKEYVMSLSFKDLQDLIELYYEGLIEQGVKPEIARYALTNATHTKIRVSFDWEGLDNFELKRLCNRAQPEMREAAIEIKKLVTEFNPFLGEKLGPHCEKYGFCNEAKGCGKAPSKKEFMELYNVGKSLKESTLSTKFYAVKVGRKTGIFNTWEDCKQQVDKFSGAEYKSFPTMKEAMNYLGVG